ncbi:hypothetical protein M758_UG267200 [Ceratodon purpureus]|nr:hypothetical protein M758_UG267200 [Ceratodon purpureus]
MVIPLTPQHEPLQCLIAEAMAEISSTRGTSVREAKQLACATGSTCDPSPPRPLFSDQDVASSAIVVDYRIVGGYTLSDHHPVTLRLQLAPSHGRKSSWKMSTHLLNRQEEAVARDILADVTPSSRSCPEQLARYRARVPLPPGDHRSAESGWPTTSFPYTLETFGDHVSKDFFHAVKERPASANITGLRTAQGDLVHTRPELEQVCLDFYSDLYRREPVSLEMATARDELLAHINLARKLWLSGS